MKATKISLEIEVYLSENESIDNFYDTEFLDDSVENDMISGAEEGFMLGYMDA